MIKRLCTLLLSLAVIWTVGAGTAQAEPGKRVHNAMQIVFSPSTPDSFCTIGAVGTDKYGHRIAISAGHCISDSTYADREIPDDIAPVYDRADIGFGPIGHVRYFKDPEGSQTGHVTKDYMVIELVPQVTLSSQGPYLKQTGEVKVPAGTASPNAPSPALDNERLLAPGDNELITSGQTGVWYGTIMDNEDGVYRSAATNMLGDSGGLSHLARTGERSPLAGQRLPGLGALGRHHQGVHPGAAALPVHQLGEHPRRPARPGRRHPPRRLRRGLRGDHRPVS
ncbi:hypothetical protein GCM10020000_12460 [Streptomyces olivoverticillatus]